MLHTFTLSIEIDDNDERSEPSRWVTLITNTVLSHGALGIRFDEAADNTDSVKSTESGERKPLDLSPTQLRQMADILESNDDQHGFDMWSALAAMESMEDEADDEPEAWAPQKVDYDNDPRPSPTDEVREYDY